MSALQAALDAIEAQKSDPLIRAKVRGLMIGYDARWKDAGWECLSAEEPYHLPVINPETGKSSRTFTQAGKFDGIVARDSRIYLLEHKTTSDDIADPDSHYWRILTIDSQVSHYVLANWQQGRKLDGTLYDVIRKPGIRPKNLAPAEAALIVKHGEYHGYQVPRELQLKVFEGQKSECVTLYEMRLAQETVANPAKYFQRRPIMRLDHEITDYASELWNVGQSIIHARNNNGHYRNSGACRNFASTCEYLPLCSGEDSLESDRWQVAEQRHSELPAFEDNGLNVLTNSRLKCFQTCRRKHQLRYEMGVRRTDAEEREALAFGHLMHVALEAWWNTFKDQKNEYSGETAPAVIEVAGAEQAQA